MIWLKTRIYQPPPYYKKIKNTEKNLYLCLGWLGDIRRDPLHARQGAGRGVGGDHHPAAGQRALRLPVRHYTQRATVCRVDRPSAPPALPRGLYRGVLD